MNPIGDPWMCQKIVVSCMTFSRSGVETCSGSWSDTVQIRDVRTGEMLCDPFRGHRKLVTDVKFTAEEIVLFLVQMIEP